MIVTKNIGTDNSILRSSLKVEVNNCNDKIKIKYLIPLFTFDRLDISIPIIEPIIKHVINL
jgi:hypothetical protein